MKIAYFISNRSTIPSAPDQITASTTVVLNIINELKSRHEITVYAAQGSRIDGVKVIDLGLPPFLVDSSSASNDWITKAVLTMKQLYIGKLFEDASQYDIIHLHTEPSYLAMPFVPLIKTPVLITTHNTYHPFEEPIFKHFDGHVNFSALSHAQAKLHPLQQEVPVIYNGIPVEQFSVDNGEGNYFLFLGRMVHDKGIDTFLELAQKTPDQRFAVSGKGEKQYEDTAQLLARTHTNIAYKGILHRESKDWSEAFGKAKALIMPLHWDEPFGLVPIEAMAHGTPVIAFNRGAMSEIIDHGKNGYLIPEADGIQGLQKAITHINSLSPDAYLALRQEARKKIESTFSAGTMGRNYEQLYEKIIAHQSS
ncbi:MAG: glycosyltransferase [Candidatus Roizmanbacteria bacterium]|nr:glycosyltransferase [Candidatus Roizmanbacteria bacterium]